MGHARRHWLSAADMVPHCVCVLDDKGDLFHANRAIDRWDLGKGVSLNGTQPHEILHRRRVDPKLHIRLPRLTATKKWSHQTPAECEVFDPDLKRRFTVFISDIGDCRQCDAGGQRFFEAPGCLARDGKCCEPGEEEQPRFHYVTVLSPELSD